MADLTKEKLTESGLQPSMVAAAGGGDSLPNNSGNEYLMVFNGSGGAITVTVIAQNTKANSSEYGEIDKPDRVVSVGAGETWIIGPFARIPFNDINGKAQVTYSGVTSLTVGYFSS